MKKTLFAAALALAACSKPAPAPAPESPLRAAQRSAAASEACSKAIPAEWSPSVPVPALDSGRLTYRLFFYGRDGLPPNNFIYHHAEGDAALDAAGRVTSCFRRAGAAAALPKSSPPVGLTMDELDRREAALYPALEDAAQLYASGREPSAEEKKRLASFASAFAFFVEPGQGPDYRALSPGFWAFIEKNGGAAPAAK